MAALKFTFSSYTCVNAEETHKNLPFFKVRGPINLWASFGQTMKGLRPKCNIPSHKVLDALVPEEKFSNMGLAAVMIHQTIVLSNFTKLCVNQGV